jgi:UDP-glucose 4-epimerase
MRIAVTGGSGFIGSRVSRALAEAGHDVVVLDVRPPDGDVEYRRFDVCRDHAAPALAGADVVYHLAGPVAGAARDEPRRTAQLQLGGTAALLEACVPSSVRRFVLASSFYVYHGFAGSSEANEDSPLDIHAADLFGAQKLMSERLVRHYSESSQGELEYVVLRFGSAYGSGRCSNVVKTFLDAARAGRPIEVWGPGDRRNQFTYVDDIAHGCVAALGSGGDETFNLVSPEETTTVEAARKIGARYGVPVVEVPATAQSSFPYVSARKAIERLEWRPRTLEAGLELMLRETDRYTCATEARSSCASSPREAMPSFMNTLRRW